MELSEWMKTASTVLADGKVDSGDVTAVAGAGLKALGVDMDAAGAAGSSPLGELLMLVVSKIEFLAQPLEKLQGSPEAVTLQAESWTGIAATYREAAKDHAAGMTDLTQWTGQAATAYASLQQATTPVFEAAAVGAEALSRLVVALGEMVAIVRKTIWDIIAQFLGVVVKSALTALASAVPTFGASIAAFAAWFVGNTVSLAKRFFTMLAKLLAQAKAVADALKQENDKLDEATRNVRGFNQQLQGGTRRMATA
ncbi:hypothetical protein ACSDQ9_11330 [Aestuariimicrobium soli]|uniref:hypothetical protein n=1 Tax=Aestuariimicrobium soli TaxID=2035834 RepID=UPI003EC0037C